ncbi:MAG: C-terminal helicase domain-containing protein, partial [Desulfovibrionaceae bacterium]|nr:C-terminal helicase domain-containing protein [Desulfovibrionaceae bacterium]
TEPKFLSLSGKTVHVAESEHVFYEVPAMGKERCLMRVIETEEPVSAIIFCNTKAHVHFVAEVLKQFGYDADELSADLSQPQRDKVLARVREGKLRFLVATDVAARGIDIPDLSHVILYEPPEDTEGYIHRAGRTGRAGASGTVISLADVIQKLDLKRIATRYAIDLQERPLPDDSQVQEVVSQRLIALLEARLRKRTPLERERLRRYLGLVERLAAEGAGTEIMAMLLDEAYQQSRHQVPSLPSGGPPPEAESPRRPRPRKGRRY